MRTKRVAVMVVFATFSSVSAAGEVPLMVLIESGSYPIGSADGPASTRPPHSVTLDPFLIDVYEVSRARLGRLDIEHRRLFGIDPGIWNTDA